MSKVLSVVHNDCFWNFCPKSISTNRNFRYQRIKAQKKGQRAKFQKLINKSTQPDLIKLDFFPSSWAWVKYFDGSCITIYSLFTIYRDIHYQLFLISYSFVHKIEICLMRSSCHNRSVEISVKPWNFHRTLDFYLLIFFQLIILIQSDHQRVYVFE